MGRRESLRRMRFYGFTTHGFFEYYDYVITMIWYTESERTLHIAHKKLLCSSSIL